MLPYYYHSMRRDLTNFSFLKHGKFSGLIVSMHQSGTHWLKHMLAMAMSREYKLPPPEFNHANDIIGGYKSSRRYQHAPYLASSHSIINPLVNFVPVRKFINMPRYVVLLRDIRATLISNFKKWETEYGCDFSEYIHGDISGKRFNHDIWWCFRFLNSWGRLLNNAPEHILLVKYEDLVKNTYPQLAEINKFLNLKLTDESILFGIEESTKEKMLLKDDPDRPEGAVRVDSENNKTDFNNMDREFFLDAIKKYLKYDFGYNYEL